MKRYTLFTLVGLLAVAGVVFAQQNEPSKNLSNERSVEFNIAELSPGGESVGYAMPASGGSPPTTEPGCAIAVNPQFAESGEKIAISWLHGIIPGSGTGGRSPYLDSMSRTINGTSFNFEPGRETEMFNTSLDDTFSLKNFGIFDNFVANAGGGGTKVPPADPVSPDLRGVLEGLSPWRVSQACIAICDADKFNCNPNNTSHWSMVNITDNRAVVASADFNQTEDSAFAFAAPNVAEAGSGGGAAACNNATNVSKNIIFDPQGLSGNYVIGIKSTYNASYGGHHSVSKENTCSTNVAINTDRTADLVPEVLIANQTFTLGEDVPLSVLIQNTGSGATDHKVNEDGKFNYEIFLDVNNNGFTEGNNGDKAFRSGGNTVGPLAKQYHLSQPFYQIFEPIWQAAAVSPGNHSLRICVDTQNKVTEIRDDNNCATATFEVVLPDIAAGAFSGLEFEYGKTLYLPGYAENTSSRTANLRITTTFQNQIEIRGGGKTIIDPANAVNGLFVAGTEYVFGSGIDPEVEFPGLRNLQYRVVVDVNDDVQEVTESNNATNWIPFRLVDSVPVATGTIVYDKVSIEVNPRLVRAGDEVEIKWNAGGRPADMCTLSPSVTNATGFEESMTSAEGDVTDNPTSMTIYKLSCGSEEASAIVQVLSSVEEN